MSGLILSLLLASGFAGLMYELAWTKQLSLIFGVTSGAISTVLVAFMGGLALGSVLLGRRADRGRRPLALYGALELGVAASALLLPSVFEGLNGLYVALARGLPRATWAFGVLRYLLCFGALLVPTGLMGGTLPAASRAWVRRREHIGGGIGVLYGINTLGGVAGTLAAGFALLRLLGTERTTLVAVGLNLMAGLIALAVSKRVGGEAPVARTKTPRRGSEAEDGPTTGLLVPVAFLLAGATSLAYEVLWTRLLVYFTGQTIYAFSTILACFLVGLALGSLLVARPIDRTRDVVAAFGLLELGIGVSAAYLLLIVKDLRPLATGAAKLVHGATEWAAFPVAFALLLVPTLLMGAAMPVATKAYARRVDRLGAHLGLLYAANTVGCMVGSVLAGFGLLGWTGAQRGVLAVSVVNVALGLVVLSWSGWGRRAKVGAALASATALALGVALSWHPRPAALSRSDYFHLGQQLLYYHEGSEASLAVLHNPEGSRELNINGSGTAYSDYDDIVVHKMLGHVPMLLAREPQRALVVGFGLGSTSWAIAQYPLERVDCVELVPQERETAQFFADDNKGILEHPGFHFIVNDGRNYLLTTTETYDVISINAINPSLSPYLYTKEFYQLCRRRLRPGGVVCAWIPTNMSRFATLAATFQGAFDHVTLWFSNPFHGLLVATPEPLSVDIGEMERRLARPEVKRDLAEVQLDDPVRLLSTLLLDERGLSEYVGRAEVNRDDLPYVEFETTRTYTIGLEQIGRMMVVRAKPWELLKGPVPEEARARLIRYWEEFPTAGGAWAATMLDMHGTALPAWSQAEAINPEDARARFFAALAVAQGYVAQPEQLAAPEMRRRAIGVLEAGLGPDRPAERFVAPIRAVLGLLYLAEGEVDKARQQSAAMHCISPEPPEQAKLRATLGDQ